MPIINVDGVGKIEFPDSMTRAQIDTAVKNEILPALQQRTAALQTAGLPVASSIEANPFSKGTALSDVNYRVGDFYAYRSVDLLTRLETEKRRFAVTELTDTEVIFNDGKRITDYLGNLLRNPRGQTFTGSQFFVLEYRMGKKWTTRYRGIRRDGNPDEWEIDFKVVAKEPVGVPAGTFDAFKIVGEGFNKANGNRFNYIYWIAPDKIRQVIAMETINRGRRGNFVANDRLELIAYKQA
jgi:hypothetical protein